MTKNHTSKAIKSTGTGPLQGLRVLDLSRILAGPTCTQLLGDFGAEVIKVEKPGTGDDTRSWGPPFLKGPDGVNTNESGYFLSSNRNKKSVALDITSPKGQAAVRALAKTSDVLVENFKVGGLAKYGLSYDDLKGDCPELIYCSITGFGQTGPNAHRPGYDLLAQGAAGLMSLNGEEDQEPQKVGVAIADLMTGMYASSGILAALNHRRNGGGGQHIDVSLADTQTAFLVSQGVNYLLNGEIPARMGNQHPNIVPYQVFEVADGHVNVAVGNNSQFQRFCALLGLENLPGDPRYATNDARVANREVLIPLLSKVLLTLKRDDLLAKMEQASISGGPINNLRQVFEDKQTAARDMQIHMDHPANAKSGVDLIGNPLKFSKTPVTYRHPPPLCGQHNDEILGEISKAKKYDD